MKRSDPRAAAAAAATDSSLANTPPTGRRRHLSPDVRREQIVQAALGLFSRQGFARTTTREIAAVAGIAEGTIYNHFASKEDLLLAFVKSAALNTLGDLLDTLEDLDDEPAVTAIILDRLRLWEERLPVIKIIVSEALFQPRLAELIRDEIYQPAMRLLSGFLRRRMTHRRFRATDPLLAGAGMLGMSFFAFVANHFLGAEKDKRSLAGLAKTLAQLFLHGIARPAPHRQEMGKRPTRKRPISPRAVATRTPRTSGGMT